jgi:hypothetical protein
MGSPECSKYRISAVLAVLAGYVSSGFQAALRSLRQKTSVSSDAKAKESAVFICQLEVNLR